MIDKKKVQTIEIIILSLVFLSVRDRVKGKLFLCGFQVDARWDESRGEATQTQARAASVYKLRNF